MKRFQMPTRIYITAHKRLVYVRKERGTTILALVCHEAQETAPDHRALS